jgi:FkbM family methyltransferase
VAAIRLINGDLPWSDNTDWMMPADDHKSEHWLHVAPQDVDFMIPLILDHVKDTKCCIQAGGAVGVWPTRLAQYFDSVISFEPEPVNYKCLEWNTRDVDNLKCVNAALGVDGFVRMDRTEGEKHNCGAFYVVEGGDIPVMSIDGLDINPSLIYLDIEGSEYNALQGALDTIDRCHPVIGLECKFKRYGGDPIKMLKGLGYKEIAKYKNDILLA